MAQARDAPRGASGRTACAAACLVGPERICRQFYSHSPPSYPTRLRARLSSLLGHPVIVVNRGRNGDRVGDMLLRLPTEVSPENPDVVIWQLGTNALLTGLGQDDFGSLFSRGMRKSRMRAPT
jgi:lysophospholipase L1-like esterase